MKGTHRHSSLVATASCVSLGAPARSNSSIGDMNWPRNTSKTSLALLLSIELQASDLDAVWFVDLASINDHGELPHDCAGAWAAREQPR